MLTGLRATAENARAKRGKVEVVQQTARIAASCRRRKKPMAVGPVGPVMGDGEQQSKGLHECEEGAGREKDCERM